MHLTITEIKKLWQADVSIYYNNEYFSFRDVVKFILSLNGNKIFQDLIEKELDKEE